MFFVLITLRLGLHVEYTSTLVALQLIIVQAYN